MMNFLLYELIYVRMYIFFSYGLYYDNETAVTRLEMALLWKNWRSVTDCLSSIKFLKKIQD